jgi:hypothetical protein
VTPSSYSVALSPERNCGADGIALTQGGTLTLHVAISPPLRCIQGFCLGTGGSYGQNCRNTQDRMVDGQTLGIPGLTAGNYGLWFCDCEMEPVKRVPMTVTVTLTVN